MAVRHVIMGGKCGDESGFAYLKLIQFVPSTSNEIAATDENATIFSRTALAAGLMKFN
jgi:hypothetical protein